MCSSSVAKLLKTCYISCTLLSQSNLKKMCNATEYEKNIVSLHTKQIKMSRLKPIIDLVSHYKYAITIVAGIAIVGFIDENSFVHRIQLDKQISDLESEIEKYNARNEADLKQIKALRHGTAGFEKIARERYFMKTDDEDIYVLSDDKKPETNDNETTQ